MSIVTFAKIVVVVAVVGAGVVIDMTAPESTWAYVLGLAVALMSIRYMEAARRNQ